MDDFVAVCFALFYSRIVVEHEAVLAQDWAQNNFQVRVSDSRFDSVEFQCFYPQNSLTNAKKIDFYLPRFTGPNLYIPKEMYLKVELELCKADGVSPPDATANVGPVNNVLHSLFSECRVYIEDYLINDNNENYAYKAFLIDTLSYDMNAKYSYLQAQGYYQDTPGNMDSAGNASFGIRRDFFKLSDKSAYSTNPVSFVGKLHSDLLSSDCGIIPGIALRIELTRADVDFSLLIPSITDTEKYQLKVKEACLLCSVATLSSDHYLKLQQNLETKSAAIYYKRVQVQNKAIPANSKTFISENLYSATLMPSRLILAFLPTTTFLGSRTKNPFNFARKWSYTTSTIVQQMQDTTSSSRRSSYTILGHEINMPSTSRASQNQVNIPAAQDVMGTKTIFLEKINLTLNGKSLDGWEGNATENSDPMMYLRLHHYLGLTDTTTGNNLTMDEFLGGAFFCVYDLTTSSQSFLDFVVPSVRLGNLRLKVEFSETTVEELTLLMYAEFPSLIQIDKFRRIKMSFL